jgi:hypothetical protein
MMNFDMALLGADRRWGDAMDRLRWIRELAEAERKMEESGLVDLRAGFDAARVLQEETIDFCQDLKRSFVESASAFNQLKNSSVGTIKIYGISKTEADFMLFRNGYKLIFSVRKPGEITITFNHVATAFQSVDTNPTAQAPSQVRQDLLSAQWGPYGQLKWTFQGQQIQLDFLVRYYLTNFVKESAK